MKTDKNIWIVEDDPGAQFVYREVLGLRYELSFFGDLQSFRERFKQLDTPPSLIIADILLPDDVFLAFLSNKEFLRMKFPLLIVSSVDDIDAVRACYDKGVVDYITKPFGKSELIVKVERIFGENKPLADNAIFIDPISLKVGRGEKVSELLTSKEFQIFAVIYTAPGHTICRDEIVNRVWGTVCVGTKTLDVHIFNLRKKISSLGIQIYHTPPNSYLLLHERPN